MDDSDPQPHGQQNIMSLPSASIANAPAAFIPSSLKKDS
jgi:hypothetical protein